MTKAELLKKNRNQMLVIEVLKDLLLDEKESRNKLELNYKYLSDAVNSGLRKNSELEAEVKRLKGLLDMDSSLDDAIIKDAELIRELKAELKTSNKRYQELSEDYKNDMDASEELDDKHSKIIRDLEKENDSLQDQLKNAVNDYESLLNMDAVK